MSLCATNTYCVSPSQYWDGADGPWSTFTVRIGTPPKPVRLLPATSQSTIWSVLSIGCTGYSNAPANCSDIRGQTFDPTGSTSFDYDGYKSNYDKNIYFQLPFETESPLSNNVTNYTGNALVGSDTVVLGSASDNTPSLLNQTLALFAGNTPFLGQLGLKAQDSTIANLSDVHTSVLGFLNASGYVASAAYGYTAGSFGRNTYGSLTFGGYDAARFDTGNIISQQLSAPSYRELQVAVSGLSIGSTTPVSGFDATPTYLIDSMVPEIWLPTAACDQIASAYGLTYNPTWEVYTLSDAQHQNLTSLDQSTIALTFTLQALGSSPGSIKVTIPYTDLDHKLSYPRAGITTGSVRYFPIKRAASSDQYYLGRTFLQDAYIRVDYDRGTFDISPALFPEPNTKTDIVQIYNHEPASNNQHSGLSAGAIAGIAIGAAAAVALIAGLIFFYFRRRKRNRTRFSMATTFRSNSMDGTTIHNDIPPEMIGGYFGPQHEPKADSHYGHYNPKGPAEMDGEEQDQFKPELQGSGAHREMSSSRHELYGSSIRRHSDQSRASISPLPRDESQRGRFGHLRQQSDSSFGQPSPASLTGSPPLAPDHLSGHPSPPMDMSGFAGPFELHGGSRSERRAVTSSPTPAPTAAEPLLSPQTASIEHAQDVDSVLAVVSTTEPTAQAARASQEQTG